MDVRNVRAIVAYYRVYSLIRKVICKLFERETLMNKISMKTICLCLLLELIIRMSSPSIAVFGHLSYFLNFHCSFHITRLWRHLIPPTEKKRQNRSRLEMSVFVFRSSYILTFSHYRSVSPLSYIFPYVKRR